MRRNPYLWSLLASLLGAGQLLAACSDGDAPDPGAAGTTQDAGATMDADGQGDAPGPRARRRPDPEDAATDAGPPSSVARPHGLIQVFDDAAFAYFFEDDTILRASTRRVRRLRPLETKPASAAGDRLVAPTAPILAIRVEPDEFNFYGAFDPVFPPDAELDVTLEMNATSVFPAIGVQTLRTPPVGTVAVSQPSAPATGNLSVPSDRDFVFTWTVPATTDGLRMQLHFADITSTSGRRAQISCAYPLAAGTGRIPASLLAAVKTQLGNGGEGFVYTFAGGGGELVVAGTSYVIFASRQDSTSLGQFDAITADLE